MALEAILDEVDQLHNVSTRLEGLAERHTAIAEALIARSKTNWTASEHFGQEGKTLPFRSVISRCAECAWKQP